MDDWGECKSDKLSFSGEPDEDDTLDFQPVQTAFEKSSGSANIIGRQRKGRTFGSKVKVRATSSGSSSNERAVGNGTGSRFRIQRSIQTFFGSNAAARDALESESGILADESSPEPTRRGARAHGETLSDDRMCDFGDMLEQQQPTTPHSPLLVLTKHSLAPSNTHRTSMTHSRSTTFAEPPMIPVRPRRMLLQQQQHTRSSSSIATLEPRPEPSAPPHTATTTRRLLHRSHSLALGSRIPSVSRFNHHAQPWATMEGGDHWEENVNPNDLDAIEKPAWHSNAHKRVRGRRHSITATRPHSSTPTAVAQAFSSVSSSLASSVTHLPSDLNWLGHCESMGALSALSQGSHNKSPTERSITSSSCRKRGVNGSPIVSDDFDDWLTLSSSSISVDARRNRSRSRIFSPLPGETMPLVPLLVARQLDAELPVPSSETKRHRADLQYGGRGDAMDLGDSDDDDDDDEQSDRKTTPDSSFDSVNMVASSSKVEPGVVHTDDNDTLSQPKRILAQMPSLDDLDYLIHELQEQELRQNRGAVFGSGDVWKVTPPCTVWTSQRRVAFTEWAKNHLGFTIRPVGMGFMYLQISKSRGTELLANLKTALVEFKEVGEGIDRNVRDESSQSLFRFSRSSQGDGTKTRSGNSRTLLSSHTISPAPMSIFSIDDAEHLVDKVSALSLASQVVSSASHSLIRMVTLPSELGGCDRSRLSTGSCSKRMNLKPISSRPSFDGLAHSMNLNLHCFDDSPRVSLGRPPKTSFNGVCSIDTMVHSAHRSVDRIMGTPCNDERAGATLHFVTTPQMCQERGWGSRPIDGKDWGATDTCEFSLMAELVARFERACGMEGSRQTSEACIDRELSLRKYNFDFEEASIDDDAMVPELREVSRKNRKRLNAVSMRRRISLYVAASGAKTELPKHNFSTIKFEQESDATIKQSPSFLIATCKAVTCNVFSFMSESELMTCVAPVCREWSDWAAFAHANLLLSNVQRLEIGVTANSSFERSWMFIHDRFPRACFLAEGGAKKVYKAFNSVVNMEEAISVMDTHQFDNFQIVANELAISAMLSSLVRLAICPNFLALRGVFSAAFPPPESHWGCGGDKCPQGKLLTTSCDRPLEPMNPEPGRYQYIRTELINEGDTEELIKRQENELFPPEIARSVLFQIAFGLYVAADKFSVKHYDVKLLNMFVQRMDTGAGLLLRYALGSHVFALKMPRTHAFVAKIADFGTSNMSPHTNGLPVTIAHFTTLENTPFDFMVLGDDATQGHEHDNFGLGLCMLQLFTGSGPYEEILEKLVCPPNLKRRLKAIWEDDSIEGYSVIRSVIFDGVDTDEEGNIVAGSPDETFYHTLYRFLVLFGIPKVKFQDKTSPRVWKAISDTLEPTKLSRAVRKKSATDFTQYCRDCKKYSIRTGNNRLISRARGALSVMEGGLELLLALCDFNPMTRATAMEVLNSSFMACLRERSDHSSTVDEGVTTYSYMTYATQG